jgi:hypothetical protein
MKAYLLIAALAIVPVSAQSFSSGSTGSDGALTFTTPGTYVFNPKTFTPPLDPGGTGMFNFTTITIAAGVTLRLAGDVYAAPVIWLAQGAVTIDGIIDASGQPGFSASTTTQRTMTVPGSGGYPGGYPGVGANPAGAGLGPGAGIPTSAFPCIDGGFTGNQFAVPLFGGSGGSGYQGHAGGAGGGAILIASSVSITGSGSILANGGERSPGATATVGSGGAIRLVAPSVALTGLLNASVAGPFCNTPRIGSPPTSVTRDGIVRIEAFSIGPINARGQLYTATPFGLFVSPDGIPSLRVVSVGGSPVATSPTGTFTIPDVTVNSNSPLPFAIQANNVPPGTVVRLVIFSENGPDQTIVSPPLAGTLASSSATANATLPPGYSRGFVTASFTP